MQQKGIPVIVVAGGLRTGKSAFIHQLLAAAPIASPKCAGESPQTVTVVISTHVSMPLPAGALHWPVSSTASSVQSDCACCGVQGALVEALRNLFMQSIQRRIPAVAAVIVELGASDDPALIMSTIRFDRFLAERFHYLGCVMLPGFGQGVVVAQAVQSMSRQAALADLVLLEKASSDEAGAVSGSNGCLPEAAGILAMSQVSGLDALVLHLHAVRRAGVRRMAGLSHRTALFASVLEKAVPDGVSADGFSRNVWVSMYWTTPFSRHAFYAALQALTCETGLHVVQVSGRVRFESGPDVFNVCSVHRQIYPLDKVTDTPDPDDPSCCLVFMAHGTDQNQMVGCISRLLPGGQVFM